MSIDDLSLKWSKKCATNGSLSCRDGGMVDAGDLKSPGFRAVRVRVPFAVDGQLRLLGAAALLFEVL